MSLASATIFVGKTAGGRFEAYTYLASAISPVSPEAAALLAGARHFGVKPEQIDLTRESDHVLVAYVRPLQSPAPAPRGPNYFRTGLIVLGCTAVLCGIYALIAGGAL